jgi:hypothetical protein
MGAATILQDLVRWEIWSFVDESCSSNSLQYWLWRSNKSGTLECETSQPMRSDFGGTKVDSLSSVPFRCDADVAGRPDGLAGHLTRC